MLFRSNELTGGMDQTTSLNEVVRQIGPPVQSQEESTLFGRYKLLDYDSQDEFGNPATCELKFWYAINYSAKEDSDKWRLVAVNFGPRVARK